MSGGYFDYKDMYLNEIAESLDELIEINNIPDDYNFCNNFSKETLKEFQDVSKSLKILRKRIHNIDLLVECDIGEETFLETLKEFQDVG